MSRRKLNFDFNVIELDWIAILIGTTCARLAWWAAIPLINICYFGQGWLRKNVGKNNGVNWRIEYSRQYFYHPPNCTTRYSLASISPDLPAFWADVETVSTGGELGVAWVDNVLKFFIHFLTPRLSSFRIESLQRKRTTTKAGYRVSNAYVWSYPRL